ncbi:MAG: LemA family protein [Bacteroidales bacterium]|nr:LemA family protein [Bacteroidales bacterium]
MKKSLIIIIVLALVALLVYGWFKTTYNTMVQNSEQVDSQWAQVENVYQRRADLIPNLVNTVKGYAAHEKDVLTDVIEARSKASSINLNAENLTEANMKAFQQAQDGLSSALSRLMVVVERYPELKANQNFLELQAQLEGTENRITVERQKFNETTRVYNTYIKSFPQNIFSGMFGFTTKPYFEAAAGSETAPKVEF